MKKLTLTTFISLIVAISLFGQVDPDISKGANYIETKVYDEKDDAEILKLCQSLRVADVSDGMDMVDCQIQALLFLKYIPTGSIPRI